MNKRSQFVTLSLRVGFVISCLVPLFVYYWIINTPITAATEYYQYLLPCVGGLLTLLAIAGAIFFLILLIRSSEGYKLGLIVLFPIAIWAFVITIAIINPLNNIHMKFQLNIGKSDFSRAELSGFDLRNADLRYLNLTEADLSLADLSGAYLRGVELIRANLIETKLINTDLSSASLLDATVKIEQLACTSTLVRATMPDGKQYDGRFNLAMDQPEIRGGSFSWSQGREGRGSRSIWDPSLEPEEIMAQYYSVSLKEYLAGQEWADENLDKIRIDR